MELSSEEMCFGDFVGDADDPDSIHLDSIQLDHGPSDQSSGSGGTFQRIVAQNIDAKLSVRDALSMSFLCVNNIKAALGFCRLAEEKNENIVLVDSTNKSYGIMEVYFITVYNKRGCSGSWPKILYESLYHIGSCIKILYYDLEFDVDKEEKQLEDAHNIPAIRLLLFQLFENMDSMDQSLFVEKLKMHYPSLKDAKMLETVLLDLMVGAEEGSVCEIVYKSLGSMGRNDLIEIFTSRNCGNPACVVHSSAKNFYTRGPGLTLIINQREFLDRALETRKGTDRDKDELIATFSWLGVRQENLLVAEDLSDNEIREKLEMCARRANQPNSDIAWLAVVILSHGRRRKGEDEILGVNGEGVVVDEIVDMFNAEKCPNMQNKPKFFWIQACRGNEDKDDFGDWYKNGPGETNRLPTVNQIPALLDTMIHCSTVANYVAYRSINEGSFFIQALCEVLQKHAETETLHTMLLKVNEKVTTTHPAYPSMAEVRNNRLRKDFKFLITEENTKRFKQLKHDNNQKLKENFYH